MELSELPPNLEAQVARLPGHFAVRTSRVLDQVILEATVRGARVTLYLNLDSYPEQPPRLELADPWRWSAADSQGRIQNLTCLQRWNRTLQLSQLLRELEQRFRETPPVRSRRPTMEGSRLSRLWQWLRSFWRRLRPGSDSEQLSPDAIRLRYQEIIQGKADRLARYQEAVDQLIAQLHGKRARLLEIQRTTEEVQRERQEALSTTRQRIETLGLDEKDPAIRQDEVYAQGLESFRNASTTLEELGTEAQSLSQEETRLQELIQEHRDRLERLGQNLEDLREEAADRVAELAATRAEAAIREALSEASQEEPLEDLSTLRKQLEELESQHRIERELSTLERNADGREFLESAETASSTEAFDVLLGLSESVDREAREGSNRLPDSLEEP